MLYSSPASEAVGGCSDNDAGDPSLGSGLSRKPAFTRHKTRCIHVTHAIDELNFLSTSSPNDNYTVAEAHGLAAAKAGGAGPVTCLVSPISLQGDDAMRCVCVPDYRSREHQISLRLFSQILYSSDRLGYYPGEILCLFLAFSWPILEKRPGTKSDEYHHAMPSSLSISIGQGSTISITPAHPHLGGSGGLRAAAISDPMRQNAPDVVQTASLTARIALPASPPIKEPLPKPAGYADFDSRRSTSALLCFQYSPLSPHLSLLSRWLVLQHVRRCCSSSVTLSLVSVLLFFSFCLGKESKTSLHILELQPIKTFIKRHIHASHARQGDS